MKRKKKEKKSTFYQVVKKNNSEIVSIFNSTFSHWEYNRKNFISVISKFLLYCHDLKKKKLRNHAY